MDVKWAAKWDGGLLARAILGFLEIVENGHIGPWQMK